MSNSFLGLPSLRLKLLLSSSKLRVISVIPFNSVGEIIYIYMLPSNMNLNIKTGTAGYNNKMLVSDSKFSLAKNDKVFNALRFTPKISHKPTITHLHKQTITHEDEKVAFVLSL